MIDPTSKRPGDHADAAPPHGALKQTTPEDRFTDIDATCGLRLSKRAAPPLSFKIARRASSVEDASLASTSFAIQEVQHESA